MLGAAEKNGYYDFVGDILLEYLARLVEQRKIVTALIVNNHTF